ncbi:Uncharacterised protein [Amycolatopsis camponoti]|uniref:Uncharacterized protein n=1 Tax=Amycolatopsis camponoti TaxID=2606593 RepID=A0A6I8LM41_9PSEU|nr:Uncharacterised protein [Amycolatopsis camponoti]
MSARSHRGDRLAADPGALGVRRPGVPDGDLTWLKIADLG